MANVIIRTAAVIIKSGPLSPYESAAPTRVPIPRHPDEVGADIISRISRQLWLQFDRKLSSQSVSEVLRFLVRQVGGSTLT